jgi:hypothetical protein
MLLMVINAASDLFRNIHSVIQSRVEKLTVSLMQINFQ